MAEALSYTTASSSWRRKEFRKLLCDISDKLDEKDIHKIKYMKEMTGDNARDCSGLDVLVVLEKQGVFSPSNTEPLAELLHDINRNDLAENVRAYQTVVVDDHEPVVGEITSVATVRSKPVSRASSLSLPIETTTSAQYRDLRLRRWQTMTHGPVAVTVSSPGEKSPALSAASSRSEVNIYFHMPPSPAVSESMISSGAFGDLASNPLSPTSPPAFDEANPRANLTQSAEGNDDNKGLVLVCGNASAANIGVEKVPSDKQVASPKSLTEEGHERRSWKRKLGWKGKRDDVTPDFQKRISRYTWVIDHSEVTKYSERINCPKKLPVDIGCGDSNPYLTFHIHCQGIFDDSGKSMTLQIKVVIPDNCPPIHDKATFDLSWEILINEGPSCIKIRHPKKPAQVRILTGMKYFYKFLPYSVLPKNEFKSLEISLCVTTGYLKLL